MDNRTPVGQEDDAQPRRASRGTDRRHHTGVNRHEKEICNIGRILCASSRVSNLASATYFGSVANLHYSGAKGFLRIPMAG
jgi:hypothetical protein